MQGGFKNNFWVSSVVGSRPKETQFMTKRHLETLTNAADKVLIPFLLFALKPRVPVDYLPNK